MKKYIPALSIVSIVLAMVLVQCTPAANTNQQETAQEEVAIPTNAVEPAVIDESTPTATPVPVNAPTPAAKPVPIAKLTPKTKPTPITKPVRIAELKPTAKPVPMEEPTPVATPIPVESTPAAKPVVKEAVPVAKPIPMEKPAALTTAGFTLKVVKATIKGTSTLHAWESQITEIAGKGSFQLKDQLITTIQDAEIKIAVKGIKSKEGKKMDEKTYDTFAAEENPFITYSFRNAAVKTNASQGVTIEASGNLSMAGASKPLTLSATGKALPNGDLHLTVSQKIKMTDFNMKPPVMFLGTIKVGDEITVSFEFELTKLKK